MLCYPGKYCSLRWSMQSSNGVQQQPQVFFSLSISLFLSHIPFPSLPPSIHYLLFSDFLIVSLPSPSFFSASHSLLFPSVVKAPSVSRLKRSFILIDSGCKSVEAAIRGAAEGEGRLCSGAAGEAGRREGEGGIEDREGII